MNTGFLILLMNYNRSCTFIFYSISYNPELIEYVSHVYEIVLLRVMRIRIKQCLTLVECDIHNITQNMTNVIYIRIFYTRNMYIQYLCVHTSPHINTHTFSRPQRYSHMGRNAHPNTQTHTERAVHTCYHSRSLAPDLISTFSLTLRLTLTLFSHSHCLTAVCRSALDCGVNAAVVRISEKRHGHGQRIRATDT